MNFESHGRKYEIDRFGVVNQVDGKPFVYDDKYASTYDTEGYKRGSDILQALRLAFATGAHGRPIRSILDCGYGNGAFMKFARQQVPYVYGCDVTGIQVESCYILPEYVKADVFTFFDALEHIPDLSFLNRLPAETVIISLPYCHIITEGKNWFDGVYPHRKPDEHLHHFNEISLGNLLAFHGWKTVAVSSHEDIIRKSKHGLQNILSMAFKRN